MMIGKILAAVFVATCAFGSAAPPNVLFILADDLGLHDLSGEGSSYYESPNIDRLKMDGMSFSQGYAACSVCSPSRASIMLGTFPSRHGITEWIGAASGTAWKRNGKILPAEYAHELPSEPTSLAEAFRDAGYRTFFAGKWHLGGEGSLPEDHGFEVNVGGNHRGSPHGGYFSPYKNPQMKDGPAGELLPIRLANETVSFIEQNKQQPFLAYLSFYSVHGPIQTTEALWKKYVRKAGGNPADRQRFKVDRTLPVRQVQDCPIYAGMIESMDDAVGVVLDALDRMGLAENTIVVFTSDNGGVSSGDAYSTSNLPLRGGKGRQWEGGIREPYYIKAPGVTKPGSTCDTPVSGVDFYPTLLDLAGLDLRPQDHRDGVSLVPLLKGGKIAQRALLWHYPHYSNQGGDPSSTLRRGNMKLIHYWEDGSDELYDLAGDPYETSDIAAANPEVVRTMRAELDRMLAETGAKIPAKDPRFDPVKHEKWLETQRTKRLKALEKQHAQYLDPAWNPKNNWWGSKVTND